MSRLLRCVITGALAFGPASGAAPAAAQTFNAEVGSPVVPIVPIGVAGAPGGLARVDLKGGALLPVSTLVKPISVVGTGPALHAVAIKTAEPVRVQALAGSAPGSRPETAAATLARSREGLAPNADNAPFWSTYWTGSTRAQASASSDVDAEPRPDPPSSLERSSPSSKDVRPEPAAPKAAAVLGAVGAPMLAMPSLHGTFQAAGQWIAHTQAIPWVHDSIPYAIALAILVLGKPVARYARKLADKIADKAEVSAGTRLLLRHAAGWASWITTGIVASQVAGVDPASVAKTLGVTTLAMSLALKGFLGNLIQGGTLLLSHPFDIGDNIRIAKVDYSVVSMTLREVILTKDGGATHMHMSYSALSELPITVFKPYATGRSFLQLHRPNLTPPSLPGGRGWLKMASYAALGLSVAVPGAAFVHQWLVKTIPWLYALGVGVATFFATRYAPKVADRFATSRKWGANEKMLARMGAPAATFLFGLAAALRILGVSWAALAASAGVTGIVVTIAATELIQSTISSLTLLASQPFTLGDRIKVGDDYEGTVVDITMRYVVIKLDSPAEAYTLLPVSLFTKFEAPGDAATRGRR